MPVAIIGLFLGIIIYRFKEPLAVFGRWIKGLFGAGAEQVADASTYTQIVYER